MTRADEVQRTSDNFIPAVTLTAATELDKPLDDETELIYEVPRQVSAPVEGCARPARIFSNVVLPLPLGPVISNASPGFNVKSISVKSVAEPRCAASCCASSIAPRSLENRTRIIAERPGRTLIDVRTSEIRLTD